MLSALFLFPFYIFHTLTIVFIRTKVTLQNGENRKEIRLGFPQSAISLYKYHIFNEFLIFISISNMSVYISLNVICFFQIEVGDVICEIETDKATLEFESLEEG